MLLALITEALYVWFEFVIYRTYSHMKKKKALSAKQQVGYVRARTLSDSDSAM